MFEILIKTISQFVIGLFIYTTVCADNLNNKNYTYRYHINSADEYAQSYDLFLPEHAGKDTPLLVFIHGGYWQKNDQSYGFGKTIAMNLKQRGIATALIRYRLAPENNHPKQIEDVATAFNHLIRQNHNKNYSIDCIIAAGHSAGAHLLALLALNPKYLAQFQLDSSQIKHYLLFSGIYHLSEDKFTIKPARLNLYKTIFGETKTLRNLASPHHFIGKNKPEFLIFYGSHDFSGFDIDAKFFYQALKETGNTTKLFELNNRNHFQIVDFALNESEVIELLKSNFHCLSQSEK